MPMFLGCGNCNCPACPSISETVTAKKLLTLMRKENPYCFSCTGQIFYNADPFSRDDEPRSNCRYYDCYLCPVQGCMQPLTKPKPWELTHSIDERFPCCGHPCHAHCYERWVEGRINRELADQCPGCMYSPLPRDELNEFKILLSKAERFKNNDQSRPYTWYAPTLVAERYFDGAGGAPETNVKKAMEWWTVAAEDDLSRFQSPSAPDSGGDSAVAAQLKLGETYSSGWKDVDQNLEKAKYWYEKAASSGHASAQWEYAWFLRLENPSDAEAIRLIQLAANQGHPEAIAALAEKRSENN